MKLAGARNLNDSDGSRWINKALTNGQTYLSEGFKVDRSTGFAALLALTDASIDISIEVSIDNSNWYVPKDTTGADLSVLADALAADRWIVFSPQLAIWTRIKVLANATAITSMKFVEQEQH